MRHPTHSSCALLVATVVAAACASAQSTATPVESRAVPASTPTLIVHITVDQMRPDYLTRWAGQLKGGLARLAHGGAVFTNAFQDHAVTETAPGHASTLSGRFPRGTNIVQNTAGVEDPSHPLVFADGPGASPFRFRGTTLSDWLQKRDRRSRTLSISRKDRGAILPSGRGKNAVFWYAPPSGMFTTSTWYADTLPTWLVQFNARQLPETFAGKTWSPLLPESDYPEPDSVPLEAQGKGYTFPHVAPSDPAQAAASLIEFPWMDEVTVAAALAGVRAMNLGAGPQTDVLAVSLSTTDAIGHKYGPESREQHDNILRLDRTIGMLIDSLYAMRDSTKILFSLTADHGGAPYPGVMSKHDANHDARFVTAAWDTLVQVTRRVRAKGVDTSGFLVDPPFVLARPKALAAHGLKPDSLVDALERSLRAIPGVMRAETMAEVAKHDTTSDAIARRWVHMFPSDLPVALTITLDPYDYWWEGIATHGTPHDYDAHVPVIFYGPPFKPGHYDAFARVVDIAPTLAQVLGVTPAEKLDGHPLTQAIK